MPADAALCKAAEDGHQAAQYELGRVCASEQDHAQAAVWWQRSAEQGCVEAQFSLAHCYLEGRGVAQDLMQSVTWCQKASSAQSDQGVERQQVLFGGIVLSAAETGDLACLQQIHIHDGMPISCKWRDSDAAIVMHTAVIHGHVAIVRWLHEHGFDAAAPAGKGLTPASVASQRCRDAAAARRLRSGPFRKG
jgi:TPR repeat protein